MKKLLLIAAIAAGALSSQAAFLDKVSVSLEGSPVTEGSVIDVNTYHDNEWWHDPETGEDYYMGAGYQYVAEIDLVNKTSSAVSTSIEVSYTDHPTEAMAADREKWGTLQLCEKGTSCFPALHVDSKIAPNGTLTWQFDNNIPTPDLQAENRKYQVTLTADGDELTFFVNFNNPDAGNGGNSSADAFLEKVSVSLEGTPVTEGLVVDVNTYHDNEWWHDPETGEDYYMGAGYQYVAEIDLVNKTSSAVSTSIEVSYTDHPTEAMATDREKWGTLQLCEKGTSCFPALHVDSKLAPNGTLTWQFDNNIPTPELQEPNRKYQVTLTADGNELTFFVNFNSPLTGVGGIAADNGVAVYYDLQGRRVVNPEKGLYFVRKDGKTSKVMIR